MSFCFIIAPLHRDLWGCHFRAADSHHIAGVIPFHFQYDNWFQSKLITVHRVNELYIYAKFHQGMSTLSDSVVDYSHVRGWLFPRGLSRCYEPVLYHHKHKSTAEQALNVHFFLYFSYAMRYCFLIAPLNWDLWGARFRAADSYQISGETLSISNMTFCFSQNWLQCIKLMNCWLLLWLTR